MGARRFVLILGLISLAWCLNPNAMARDLTFEDRINAQEAIERVYYSHRTGVTKPFEVVVPRAVLEQKVRTYLQETAALEIDWKTPITAQDLDRELERMARHTHLPGRLSEIRDALGGDGQLLRECLARPALVDRMARRFFAADRRIHHARGMTWDGWWARSAPAFGDASSAVSSGPRPGSHVALPRPGPEPVAGPGVAAMAALTCDSGGEWDNRGWRSRAQGRARCRRAGPGLSSEVRGGGRVGKHRAGPGTDHGAARSGETGGRDAVGNAVGGSHHPARSTLTGPSRRRTNVSIRAPSKGCWQGRGERCAGAGDSWPLSWRSCGRPRRSPHSAR